MGRRKTCSCEVTHLSEQRFFLNGAIRKWKQALAQAGKKVFPRVFESSFVFFGLGFVRRQFLSTTRDFYSCGQALSRSGVAIVCRSIRLNVAQLPRETHVHHRFRGYVLLRGIPRPSLCLRWARYAARLRASRVVISHRLNVVRITVIIAMWI